MDKTDIETIEVLGCNKTSFSKDAPLFIFRDALLPANGVLNTAMFLVFIFQVAFGSLGFFRYGKLIILGLMISSERQNGKGCHSGF